MQPGDVVLLVLDHSYDLVIGFLGALYVGAVPVILPYPRPNVLQTYFGQLEILIRHTEATAVFATHAVTELAQELQFSRFFQIHPFDIAAVGNPPEEFSEHRRKGVDTLYLQLTSGTTGTPKMVMLSQQAVMNNIRGVFHVRYQPGGPVVGCMPFNHDGGFVLCLLVPLIMGQLSIHIKPVHWITQPKSLWQTVTNYRGALTFVPNFALNFMVHRIPDSNLSLYELDSLHTIIVSAELITYQSLNSFYQTFQKCGLGEGALCGGFGMAEQVVGVSLNAEGWSTRIDWVDSVNLRREGLARKSSNRDAGAVAVVSCGIPLNDTEICIVDDDYCQVKDRTVGEVLVRSQHCFSGYFGRPDLSAQAMHNDWHCTGDLGYLADEELFILGRKDDLIIVSGQNIQPQAIEEIATNLLAERGRLAVAFSQRDESLGTERPVLVCETRNDESEAQLAIWRSEIMRQVQDRLDVTLADIRFVPKGWVVQSDAKIGRSANREKYLAEGYSPEPVAHSLLRAAGSDPVLVEKALTSLFAEMLGVTTVSPNDNFFELGGDSLMALRMLLSVEEATGQRVPTEFFDKPTVVHLAGLLVTTSENSKTPGPLSDSSPLTHPPRRSVRLSREKLKKQIIKKGPIWHEHRLPYRVGVRLQRFLVAQPFVQRRFAKQLEVVKQWSQELEVENTQDEIVAINLLANTWGAWHQNEMMKIGMPNRWFSITDRHIGLLEHPSTTQGIVLAIPHTGRIGWELLEAVRQKGYETGFVRGGQLTSTQNRSKILWNAQQVLRRGGIVLLGADGRQGEQAIDVPFWGRRRPFQIGAAELAVTTGSLFVPVYIHFDVQGHVDVEISAPLIPETIKPQEQIRELTERYGADYATRWPQFFASVRWGFLAYNLSLPSY